MTSGRPMPCPVCASIETHVFFSQLEVPTQCGYLASTREAAADCTLGDIDLHHCRLCSHVWNSAFEPEKMNFNAEYDFSQYHSAKYRQYVSESIERLKAHYCLGGGVALDVACGKGEYLKLLIGGGFQRAVGFDPTFDAAALTPEEARQITVYREFYEDLDLDLQPELVSCRSALQYVPAPRPFLHSLRASLARNPATVVHFEVPNGAEAFREKVVWYVMYEAGCFFSGASLARLFRECGFQVLDVRAALGSSQLELEARPSSAPTRHPAEDVSIVAGIAADVSTFQTEYAVSVGHWRARFGTYAGEAKRVVLWAAGMRAVSLLVNVPEAASLVEYVVDINPNRQGRYLPKTGQLVVPPASLRDIAPDVVVATNPNYADEIRAQLEALGVTCEFEVLR